MLQNYALEKVSVLIVIQARSNSTRFPQKIYQMIGKKMCLQHVIDQAKSAKLYVERSNHKKQINCDILVVHPENDSQVVTSFKSHCNMLAGSELDVLSRYLKAYDLYKPDYIVRLTSDCPLILDFIISKHINTAILNDLDYVSNVEESCRTSFDGTDCEIMSAKAMEWLRENAKSRDDQEHVTLALRREKPRVLSQGFISFKLDSSNIKLSLDTEQDLQNIREYYHGRETKLINALRIFGKRGIFEL
jgi:spore coat polysaccharide biosynthesis protein SpsF